MIALLAQCSTCGGIGMMYAPTEYLHLIVSAVMEAMSDQEWKRYDSADSVCDIDARQDVIDG